MKKAMALGLGLILTLLLGACGDDREITVISREEASGTRAAFVSLTGLAREGIDRTYPRAEINSSTAVVMQTVMGNKNAIGYISMGALSQEVRALSINGVQATKENVRLGRYALARPFFLATGKQQPLAADFLSYILSQQGQALISEMGFVPMEPGGSYERAYLRGTVRVMGSSSIAPVMERLAEGYMGLNPEALVQVQTSDSTQGLSSLARGLCDIAMSSRELTREELALGITALPMCKDGIAVIVNVKNPVTELNMVQLRSIFQGEIRSWELVE